jgi:hypothetical protein
MAVTVMPRPPPAATAVRESAVPTRLPTGWDMTLQATDRCLRRIKRIHAQPQLPCTLHLPAVLTVLVALIAATTGAYAAAYFLHIWRTYQQLLRLPYQQNRTPNFLVRVQARWLPCWGVGVCKRPP